MLRAVKYLTCILTVVFCLKLFVRGSALLGPPSGTWAPVGATPFLTVTPASSGPGRVGRSHLCPRPLATVEAA